MTRHPRPGTTGFNALANTRAMYFFIFMASGAFQPFINLYFERQGLTGVQIGTLAALPVAVVTVATFIWGAVADKYQLHRKILSTTLLLAPLTMLLLSLATDYASLILWVMLGAFVFSGVLPVLDGSALELVKAHKRSYGELRLWGSIGWSIGTWLVGILIERLNIRWLFYSYILFIAAAFVLSFFQPAPAHILRTSLRQGFRRLIRRDTVIFFISILLLTTTSGAGMSFMSLYLDHIGATEGLIGLSWAVSALSEIPVMFYSGAIIKRIGSKRLLILAFLLYALRWLLFSFIENPVLALFVQVLQGFSFAAFLTGGVTYLNERTPEGLTTTAQSLFNSVIFGLAAIIGSFGGGYLYDAVGVFSMFRILSIIALAAFAFFIFSSQRMPEARPATAIRD